MVGAAGRQPQHTTEERFSGPGWTEHQGVEMLVDPVALSQFKDKAALQATGCRQFQVFQGSGLGKRSRLDQSLDTPVMAAGDIPGPPGVPGVLRRRVRRIWGC